jgi:hypothetical protein
MNGYWPVPDYRFDREWRWPWWKFELPPDALFTALHERFNTRPCPVQDPQAFLLDVRDCAASSKDRDEFYTKLSDRRDQRVRELEAAWKETSSRVSSVLFQEYSAASTDDRESTDRHARDTENDSESTRYSSFTALERDMSFDDDRAGELVRSRGGGCGCARIEVGSSKNE